MLKDNLQQTAVASNKLASLIYGISTSLTGICYLFFAPEIKLLLPHFLPARVILVYIMAIVFIVTGIAIIVNKPNARLASFVLAIMLFFIATVIDLRGIFNLGDKELYLFVQSFLKDAGLVAGALIIADFERKKKHRSHRHRRSSSSSGSKSSTSNLPES
jgi:uncharacterized membrane protein